MMFKSNSYWCYGICLILLSIAGLIYHSPAQSYDQLVIFGDSLSDTGNRGRYTFDKDKNYIYDEILAQRIGVGLTPSNQGGFNYATGGADASPALRPDRPTYNTQYQVNSYLNRVQGRANNSALYIHWIGANDLIRILANTTWNAQQQETMVSNSAQLAAGQVSQLIQAGAGTIIVPGVPNIGLTPLLTERIIRTALPAVQEAAVQAAYAILNNVATPDTVSRQHIIHQAMAAAAAQTGTNAQQQKVITAQLITAHDTLSRRAAELTTFYNQQVDQRVAQNGPHIVRADINALFTELLTNPVEYGLINTTGTSCPVRIYADRCTSEMAGFDNAQRHLFADNIHTSPYVHTLIADYLQALLAGPLQVTALSQATTAMARDARLTLDSHLQQLRNTIHAQGSWRMFGGYAGQHSYSQTGTADRKSMITHNVTIGSDYQLTEKWSVGALLSHSVGKQRPSGSYQYQPHGLLFSLFSTVDIMNYGWINADLHFINMAYNNIKRQIKLGPATRTEQGNTHGNQWSARLTAGWDIPLSATITTGPVIQYTWDYNKIYGYTENSDNSTTMRFGHQRYHSKVAGFGWRLNTDFNVIKPYAQIDWQHQLGDDTWSVTGALKSSQATFTTTSIPQDKRWMNVTLGASMPLGTHAAAFARISRTAGLNREERLVYNIGGSLRF